MVWRVGGTRDQEKCSWRSGSCKTTGVKAWEDFVISALEASWESLQKCIWCSEGALAMNHWGNLVGVYEVHIRGAL